MVMESINQFHMPIISFINIESEILNDFDKMLVRFEFVSFGWSGLVDACAHRQSSEEKKISKQKSQANTKVLIEAYTDVAVYVRAHI